MTHSNWIEVWLDATSQRKAWIVSLNDADSSRTLADFLPTDAGRTDALARGHREAGARGLRLEARLESGDTL